MHLKILLLAQELSNKSDVWSFGVFLWEVYTFGCIPYQHVVSYIHTVCSCNLIYNANIKRHHIAVPMDGQYDPFKMLSIA